VIFHIRRYRLGLDEQLVDLDQRASLGQQIQHVDSERGIVLQGQPKLAVIGEQSHLGLPIARFERAIAGKLAKHINCLGIALVNFLTVDTPFVGRLRRSREKRQDRRGG
jgi:hypothetical protein